MLMVTSRRCCSRARAARARGWPCRARSARTRLPSCRSTIVEGGLLGVAGGALGTLAAIWATVRSSRSLRSTCRAARRLQSIGRIRAVVLTAGGIRPARSDGARRMVGADTLSSLLSNSAVRGGGGTGVCVAA